MEEEGLSYSQGIHRMVFGSLFRWPDVLRVFFIGMPMPRYRDDRETP